MAGAFFSQLSRALRKHKNGFGPNKSSRPHMLSAAVTAIIGLGSYAYGKVGDGIQFTSECQVSTDRLCDICRCGIKSLTWTQCQNCHIFDVCNDTASHVSQDNRLTTCSFNNPTAERIVGETGEHTPTSSRGINHEQVAMNYYIDDNAAIEKNRQLRFEKILNNHDDIKTDRDLWIVLKHIRENKIESASKEGALLAKKVLDYHQSVKDHKVKILSLDGGGLRGYMTLSVLAKFLELHNINHRNFVNNFNYVAGTSTGGLIAFALVIGKSPTELLEVYGHPEKYFKRNWLGPNVGNCKYDVQPFHDVIDSYVEPTETGRKLMLPVLQATHELDTNATRQSYKIGQVICVETLGDLHMCSKQDLIINAYDASSNQIQIFNSNFLGHYDYKIKDVLKATMAAPTFFPPYTIHDHHDGYQPHVYLDGGIFANDPELSALWAARMDKKRLCEYVILSLGTCVYPNSIQPNNLPLSRKNWIWDGEGGLVIDMMFEANRSFTETIASELARFSNIRRFRFNYALNKSTTLDDMKFVQQFNAYFQNHDASNSDDFKALHKFYRTHINKD